MVAGHIKKIVENAEGKLCLGSRIGSGGSRDRSGMQKFRSRRTAHPGPTAALPLLR
jgi:hypothetical protein